ncbi:hypothetical protein B0H19DRAFT_1308134, partial [Mycena capillaripes]
VPTPRLPSLPTHSPAPAPLVSLRLPYPSSVPILSFPTFPLEKIPRSYFSRKNSVSAVFSIPPQAQRQNASYGVFLSGYHACRGYMTKRCRFLPSITSPSLLAVYMMPSRDIRVPCAGRSTVWRAFARTSIRGTPSRDAATKPSGPSALITRSRNPTIALTDDALDAARRRRDVLGTVPSTRFSRIRFCASLRPSPQMHLHRFHDDAERPRTAPRDPSVPHIDILPSASLVTQKSPHFGIPTVQLKGRPPPRTSAARTVASLTVLTTPPTAFGSMQTRRFVCRNAQRRALSTHITARLDTTKAHAPPIALTASPRVCPPLFPHTANSIAHGHSLKGEYSDGDGTTRTYVRASASRDDPNATEERHLRRGRYGRREWEARGAHKDWRD